MKTYCQVQTEIFKAQDELFRLKNKLSNMPGSYFIKTVESKLESEWLMTPEDAATDLAEELTQRDEPMTRCDIKEVFEASGYPYTDTTIDLAQPDTQEVVDREITRYQD